MPIRVKCPLCGKRIFDAGDDAKGEFEIKCFHCNKIIQIHINQKVITAKQIIKIK